MDSGRPHFCCRSASSLEASLSNSQHRMEAQLRDDLLPGPQCRTPAMKMSRESHPNPKPSNSNNFLAVPADQVGIWASSLCMIHCILTPVVLSISAVSVHSFRGANSSHVGFIDSPRGRHSTCKGVPKTQKDASALVDGDRTGLHIFWRVVG
jgi:hypothetical protein